MRSLLAFVATALLLTLPSARAGLPFPTPGPGLSGGGPSQAIVHTPGAEYQAGAVGPAPFPFPGTPYALYSTAKVNLSATKSFQAIRASDSATLDIGFVGGNADVASFTTFCANTTCMAKLYDQSGNGRDCGIGGEPLPNAIASNGRIWFSMNQTSSTADRGVVCITASPFTSNGDQTVGLGGVVDGVDSQAILFANYDGTNGWLINFNGPGGSGLGGTPGKALYFATGSYAATPNLYTQQNTVAFTRSSGTVTSYINGVAGTPTAGFSNVTPTNGATLGGFDPAFSTLYPMGGLFSEVYYYTSALTPTQMASIQSHEASFWPDPGFGTPATGSASVQFTAVTSEDVALGNVLDYEYTQPWTTFVAAQIYGVPAVANPAAIFFTNVPAPNGAFPGYEFWFDENCLLRVRIIHDIGVSQYIGIIGTTQVCDLKKHIFAATYDGSGTAAGVKIYIDGNLEPTTVESDTLGGHTIIGSGQSFLIGNQQGESFFLPGTMNVFRQDNVARNAAYMLSHNTASSLLTGDANTAVLLPLNNAADGTMVSDTSGNGHNGTLTDASMWVH